MPSDPALRATPSRRRNLLLALILAGLIAGLLTAYGPAGRAEAAAVVASQPMSNDYPWKYSSGLNPELRYSYRNCTDFVAWRLNKQAGRTSAPWRYTWGNLTPAGGNAYQWASQFPGKVNSTPAIGAVAWWGSSVGGGLGHVAIVSQVLSDGSVIVEEYNWGVRLGYSTRHTRAQAYIHIHDVTPTDPFGSVDLVTSPASGKVRVSGWTADPNAPTTPTEVHVVVSGGGGSRTLSVGAASNSRPDVGAAYPGYGDAHGFDATFDSPFTGRVQVCVWAINIGLGSSQQLACRSLDVADPKPFGSLDGLSSQEPGEIRLQGWAADPDAPTTPLQLQVSVRGSGQEFTTELLADVSRPDVGRAFPGYGEAHGFDATIVPGFVGPVEVCVTAVNLGSGSNASLGCRSVNVARGGATQSPGIVQAGDVVRIAAGAPNQTVLGNLTVTQPQAPGFTTAWPCSQPRPTASVNNFTTGQTTPNHAVVKTDENGEICIYTSATAHLIWDQVSANDTLPATTAQRLLDTRNGTGHTGGIVQAGDVVRIAAGAPNQTVLGNLTVTQPQAPGFTTAWPCSQPRPTASVNNFTTGQTTPNHAVVKTDGNGEVCIYTSATAHLIWDQVSATDTLPATTAQRLLDTRNGTGHTGGIVQAGGVVRIAAGAPTPDRPGQPDRDPAARPRLHHRLALQPAPAHRLGQQLHHRPDHPQPRRGQDRRERRDLRVHLRHRPPHLGPGQRHRHPPRHHRPTAPRHPLRHRPHRRLRAGASEGAGPADGRTREGPELGP